MDTNSTTHLTYDGYPIGCRGQMLNLTDMWVARGRPENRTPYYWLRFVETKRLLAQFVREQNREARQSNAGLSRIEPVIEPKEDEADNQDLGLSQVLNSTDDTTDHQDPILNRFLIDVDRRRRNSSTWAHKHIALAYAAYLSPAFHLWVLRVALNHIEREGGPESGPAFPMNIIFTQQLARLAQQVDEVDIKVGQLGEATTSLHEKLFTGFARGERSVADLMYRVAYIKDILWGRKKEFSPASRGIICHVARETYGGICPCCQAARVLSDSNQVIDGAEFDHHTANQFNQPEHGWLICRMCHDELNQGSYVRRLESQEAIHRYQDAVLLRKRQLRNPRR
jgi:hypothetical protein